LYEVFNSPEPELDSTFIQNSSDQMNNTWTSKTSL
jgi:hypothetical protein